MIDSKPVDVLSSTGSLHHNPYNLFCQCTIKIYVYGCSAEGHVSHIFSERMSSRPMGWSEEGSDGMMKLRCYVRNHGKEKIIDLVEYRRKRKLENTKATGTDGMIEADVPKKYISAERRRTLSYVERLQARIPGYTAKKALAIRERLQGI